MCGIAGIKKVSSGRSQKISRGSIRAMIDAIAHRGPDDEGVYINEKDGVALGHRRLSILDLSLAGHQPMSNEQETIKLIFNGEIYNYIELKKELGFKCKSESDSEVLIKAYEKLGEKFVNKLNGIFAFAIWDGKNNKLFAARDHLGVKPFYYAIQDSVLYFGSEIKALLAAGVKNKPNDKIIYEYLVYGYYQHSNETFFDGIYQLPAGCTLTLQNGKLKIDRYWDLATSLKDMSSYSDARVKEEFIYLLENAVKMQLRSDVPVGIQLSGGFDSSLVTAIVDKIYKSQKNFRLFSFTYGNYNDGEVPYMKALVKKLKWNLEFQHFYAEDMPKMMNEAVWHQDEPFPGLPVFGLHLLGKACQKSNIKVILGGQGGDEIEAGYEYYFGAFLLDLIKKEGVAKAMTELSGYGKLHNFTDSKTELKFFINCLHAYFQGGTSADGTSFVRPEVLKDGFVKKSAVTRPIFNAPFDSHLRNMQYRDILHTKLPRILHSSDRAAMTYGVEQRVPLIDYRLIEFGLSLEPEQKIRNGEQRFFAREASKNILPKFVGRAPKRAVPSPQREWFKKELRPWVNSILSSKSFGERPYFDQKKVLAEYERYCNSPVYNSFHIWQWIHLEIWMRTFFDK